VRGVNPPINSNISIAGGIAGNGGDSTFRCNDSGNDEDKGLISESEDGWN
jgi:hypothetical protein